MDKFEALRTFVKVVETHGFTAAAKELGLSRSAVSKSVAGLEESLGVQLLNRSTRHVSATETGASYYDRCVSILAELDDADQAVLALQGEPRGSIRLNAPMSFGTLHLGSAITDFMALYPEVRVEAILDDRQVDPVREGFDLTIRIAALTDSSLIAKKLCPANRVLCASPEYIKEHGWVEAPRDLQAHSCLHYGYLQSGNLWDLIGPKGKVSVQIEGALCSNNAELLKAGALKGAGIAMLPTFIAGPDLQTGQLVRVLPDFQPPEIAIYALYPPSRHLSVKVRLLIDFLADRFGPLPYWDLVV